MSKEICDQTREVLAEVLRALDVPTDDTDTLASRVAHIRGTVGAAMEDDRVSTAVLLGELSKTKALYPVPATVGAPEARPVPSEVREVIAVICGVLGEAINDESGLYARTVALRGTIDGVGDHTSMEPLLGALQRDPLRSFFPKNPREEP